MNTKCPHCGAIVFVSLSRESIEDKMRKQQFKNSEMAIYEFKYCSVTGCDNIVSGNGYCEEHSK